MGNSHAKLSKSEQALATSTPFDKKELERIRSVFVAVKGDKQNDELNLEEFKEVFSACVGREVSEGDGVDLSEIFFSMDTDHSGSVSFKEMILWLAIYNRGTEESKLRHMFESFDTDGSGTLEASEVNNVLDILKISMESRGVAESQAIKNAAALVKKLDKDKDGKISLEEWVALGKEAGLVQELLGSQFIEVMERFDPTGAEKEVKKKKSISKKSVSEKKKSVSGN